MSANIGVKNCRNGRHSDPDNSGMCIHCALLLDIALGEDPNDYRRRRGWTDMPTEPVTLPPDRPRKEQP